MDWEEVARNPWEQKLKDFFQMAKDVNAGLITLSLEEDGEPAAALVIIRDDVKTYLDAIEALKEKLERDANSKSGE